MRGDFIIRQNTIEIEADKNINDIIPRDSIVSIEYSESKHFPQPEQYKCKYLVRVWLKKPVGMPQHERDGLVIWCDDYSPFVYWLENDFGYTRPDPYIEPKPDPYIEPKPEPEPKIEHVNPINPEIISPPQNNVSFDVGITLGLY